MKKLLLFAILVLASCNMSNAKEGFYFDDYSRAKLEEQKEQIKADLLSVYPIGRDIKTLERDLLAQGAHKDPNQYEFMQKQGLDYQRYIYYYQGTFLLANSKNLALDIYSENNRIKIINIKVYEFTGLK